MECGDFVCLLLLLMLCECDEWSDICMVCVQTLQMLYRIVVWKKKLSSNSSNTILRDTHRWPFSHRVRYSDFIMVIDIVMYKWASDIITVISYHQNKVCFINSWYPSIRTVDKSTKKNLVLIPPSWRMSGFDQKVLYHYFLFFWNFWRCLMDEKQIRN